jgi:hypothetical protein
MVFVEIPSLDVGETLAATTPVSGLCNNDNDSNEPKIQPTLAGMTD